MRTIFFWHCFGPHAGESREQIIARKQTEIRENGGWTLWSFSGKREQTLEIWREEIHKACPSRILALCSLSRHAIAPHGETALANAFKSAGDERWLGIPPSIAIPHPFGSRAVASAFKVSRIFDPSTVAIPSQCEWFCVGKNDWRFDSVPTRGEYLMREVGNGTRLREVALVLELKEPFIVQIRR